MVTNFVILFAFPWKPTSYIIRVSMVTNLIFVICIAMTTQLPPHASYIPSALGAHCCYAVLSYPYVVCNTRNCLRRPHKGILILSDN